jgi:hypothetical protein
VCITSHVLEDMVGASEGGLASTTQFTGLSCRKSRSNALGRSKQ